MRLSKILLLLTLTLTLCGSAFTQNVDSGSDHRKITKKVAPTYPELAKRMGVSGAVKLELLVASNGKVKSVRLLGGHPVLANAALQVAQGWEFEPGTESTELVTINYNR